MDPVLNILVGGLLLVSFIFLITFYFRAMNAFTDLVKYQYENYHEHWISDGEPNGMFWRPPQRSKNFLNLMFRSNAGLTVLKWTFSTPPWTKNDATAIALLKRGRKFTLYWNIGLPLWSAILLGLIYLLSLNAGK